MTTPNPPIPGHHLLHEGHVYHRWDGRTGEHTWTGGCACGARPDEFPQLSKRAMQRWHRQHKAELRGQGKPLTEVEVLRLLVEDWDAWAEHSSECACQRALVLPCDCGLDALAKRTVAVLHG